MAKKKESDQASEPIPTSPKEKPGGRTIANWKQDVFARLPNGTNQEIADAVNAIARDNNKDYLATAEMVQKWKDDAGKEPGAKKMRGEAAPRQEPTLTDLLLVKEAGTTLDAETIQTVADLAAKVGGLDNLRRCLEALAKLAG